jgi:symplekin
MSSSPDALSLLTAALSATDAATESINLQMLYKVFQSQPGNLPPLFPTLVTLLNRAGENLKKWIVDVIDLTFCRPTLGPQGKASCELWTLTYQREGVRYNF